MSYFGEFRAHGHNLLGAAIGIGFGSALNHYMTNLFGPPLLAEFGWSKADFALIGVMPLAAILLLPFQGRFTDRYGPRIAAGIGVAILPLTFLGYSLMSGHILQFFAIAFVQALIGMLVGTLAYTRVVVEKFDAARGMALSLAMIGAPAVGGIMAPIVGDVIATEGWRAAYRFLAMVSAIGGGAAILLIGKSSRLRTSPMPGAAEITERPGSGTLWQDLRMLSRNRAFPLMVGGMFLCNLPQVLAGSQLTLMAMDSGAAGRLATLVVSIYASGVIVGRLASGLALDRLPAHLVAGSALTLPAIGFFTLASPLDTGWIVAGAILLIGLAQGAEGDIGAYLASRNFDLEHYSFAFAFISVAMMLASVSGSVVLSVTLRATDSFDMFLYICAAFTLVGAFAFYLTGRSGAGNEEAPVRVQERQVGAVTLIAGDEA